MKFISVDLFSNVVNGCNILYFQEMYSVGRKKICEK